MADSGLLSLVREPSLHILFFHLLGLSLYSLYLPKANGLLAFFFNLSALMSSDVIAIPIPPSFLEIL